MEKKYYLVIVLAVAIVVGIILLVVNSLTVQDMVGDSIVQVQAPTQSIQKEEVNLDTVTIDFDAGEEELKDDLDLVEEFDDEEYEFDSVDEGMFAK